MDAVSAVSRPPFADAHGRKVRYLRISVTDRCNLNCRYCRTPDMPFIPHDDILRFEEIEQIVAVAVEHGVGKLRFTGGEPFARKGFLPFLERVRARWPHLSLKITSNGTLIGGALDALKDLGVAVNLSLDTLDRKKFADITGRDLLPVLQENMRRMLDLGIPLKVNAVAMRGVNHEELGDLAALAMDSPLDVRFIEFMPMGESSIWSGDVFWPASSILASLRERWGLVPAPQDALDPGPSRLWKMEEGGRISVGRVGLITSVTQSFCQSCNRLRLTSDGHLRTCLYDDREYAVREALRRLGPEAVRRIMAAAVARKPVGSELLAQRRGPVARKAMSAIGG